MSKTKPAAQGAPRPSSTPRVGAQRGQQKKPGAALPPGPPPRARRHENTLGQGKATPFVFPKELEDATPRRNGLYRVRAVANNAGDVAGYIHHERKRDGDVFDVTPEEFSATWMEPVDPREALRTTGPQESLTIKHDEIVKERAGNSPIE